ncbi:MAG: DUF2155 domain-containing protein [Proteobacteria bacterium]|nr:DUF2155 domain-containing protein [Pseudomonadota bacterium]
MRKSNFLFGIFLLLASNSFAQEIEVEDPEAANSYKVANLQVLNKTTAKTSLLEIKVGEKANFSGIDISVRKCWQAPLDQRPESKILIDVSEIKIDEKKEERKVRIFYGWIFASSPSLSGLEHPIYDIVAVGCKNK